jgi:hypothetical protein
VGGSGVAISLLDEALAAIGPEDSLKRCRLLSRLASSLYINGSLERAGKVASAARILARRMTDDSSLLLVLMLELMHVGANPASAARRTRPTARCACSTSPAASWPSRHRHHRRGPGASGLNVPFGGRTQSVNATR